MRRIISVFCLSFVIAFAFSSQAQSSGVLTVSQSDELGQYLVDEAGNTLYTFTIDSPQSSSCSGDCLSAWPAFTVASVDTEIVADGISGEFSVIERDDTAEIQVTYNRQPLYYFSNDAAPGDANGEGVGDVWFVARPQLLDLANNDSAGSYLSDSTGNSLYIFTNDTEGVSNCSGDCLSAWPAFTVANANEVNAGFGVVAQDDLDVIERADTGDMQVTYQGQPLYYFANDEAPGDTNGQAVGDVWFLVNPTLINTVSSDEFGDILAGRDGTTLYTFNDDAEGVSNCNDRCAVVWPPLMASDADFTTTGDMQNSLSLIERADGSSQVAYNGQPLYYYFADAVSGDTNGQGAGDVWFVVPAEMMADMSDESCNASSASNVNLRGGPGTLYSIAGAFIAGEDQAVIGQANGTDGFVWWQLESQAWVRSDLVTVEGSCDAVPSVTAPPPPPPPPPTAVPAVQATSAPAQQPAAPAPATTEDP